MKREEAMTVAFQMTADALVGLLRKYGRHRLDPSCSIVIGKDCDCGWEELKAKLDDNPYGVCGCGEAMDEKGCPHGH